MAQYGLNVYTISRLQGGSAVRATSYILREKLYDSYNNKNYDYTHLKDFFHSEVLLPEQAPTEFHDPVVLCNAMEQTEKRYDGRTGRGLWLSLPNELTPDEWKELVREFTKEAFVSLGMCAIVAIHDEKNPDDPTKNNPNAHIILTDRPVDSNGFRTKKNRDWNDKKHVRVWRKMWADDQNRIFERKGLEVRVNHESLEVQGIDREPTIPLGRAAVALERKGIATESGNINRAIEARNKEREDSKHIRRRERSREHSRER